MKSSLSKIVLFLAGLPLLLGCGGPDYGEPDYYEVPVQVRDKIDAENLSVAKEILSVAEGILNADYFEYFNPRGDPLELDEGNIFDDFPCDRREGDRPGDLGPVVLLVNAPVDGEEPAYAGRMVRPANDETLYDATPHGHFDKKCIPLYRYAKLERLSTVIVTKMISKTVVGYYVGGLEPGKGYETTIGVWVFSWPEKQVKAFAQFTGEPPSVVHSYDDPVVTTPSADGEREAWREVDNWLGANGDWKSLRPDEQKRLLGL